MNLNIINLHPKDWSKTDWQDAYKEYCKNNMFGPKTKQEYYNMVLENYKKLANQNKPLSDELAKQWLEGWRSAVNYARVHKCDRDGTPLSAKIKHNEDALVVAERAEDMAIDSVQKIEYLVKLIKRS